MYPQPHLTQGPSTFPALSPLNSVSQQLPRRAVTRYISSVANSNDMTKEARIAFIILFAPI